MSRGLRLVLAGVLLAGCDVEPAEPLVPPDGGDVARGLAWRLERLGEASLEYQHGCAAAPVRMRVVHDGPSRVEVGLRLPEGWGGPARLVVASGEGAVFEVQPAVEEAFEPRGEVGSVALVDASGRGLAEAPISYSVRPSHWVEVRHELANVVLTLAIGASGSYDSPAWLLERLDAWATYIAEQSGGFSHVGVVYVDDGGAIRWATESSEGDFVDPRSPRALERLRAAITQALLAARPGVAGRLDEAFRQHPGGGERRRATTLVYRAIEEGRGGPSMSPGGAFALASFEPDGCTLESGERVPFAYPTDPDITRFFYMPICADFVELTEMFQNSLWIPLDCDRVTGEAADFRAWVDGEARTVQLSTRNWCGVLLGAVEREGRDAREARIEGKLDCEN